MLITFHILYKKGQKFVNSNIYYKLNSERISKQTKKNYYNYMLSINSRNNFQQVPFHLVTPSP